MTAANAISKSLNNSVVDPLFNDAFIRIFGSNQS